MRVSEAGLGQNFGLSLKNKALKQVQGDSQICADMPGSFYQELYLFPSHGVDLERWGVRGVMTQAGREGMLLWSLGSRMGSSGEVRVRPDGLGGSAREEKLEALCLSLYSNGQSRLGVSKGSQK